MSNKINTDGSSNNEAVKIANALKPFVKNWFQDWGRSCVRYKKMTVSTAPNGSVIGVKDAFSDQELFIKYMSACSNAQVGDTVWCKWMFDNMQTLYADGMGDLVPTVDYVPSTGGTFTGNVNFNGGLTSSGAAQFSNTVDITNRRAEAFLSAVGWYRVLTMNLQSANQALGIIGSLIDFEFARYGSTALSEQHKVSLCMAYNRIVFSDETSYAPSSLFIDAIRYNVNGANGYVDIHYNSTGQNKVNCNFVATIPYEYSVYGNRITSNNFTAVGDSPSDETVVATYNFLSDGNRVRNLTVDGSILTALGDLSNTGERISKTSPSGYSIESGTYVDALQYTFEPGTWLVYGFAQFASNATGYRRLVLSRTSTTSGALGYGAIDTNAAISGIATNISAIYIPVFTASTTYHLLVYQNSGSNLGVNCGIQAIRLN